MNVEPTPSFEELLAQWEETEKQAKRLVHKERQLREALVAAAFPAAKLGTNSRELVDGRIVKAVVKENMSIDQEAAESADRELTRLNHPGVFRIKRELDAKAYKELSDEQRKIADAAITRKPGAPTLVVI